MRLIRPLSLSFTAAALAWSAGPAWVHPHVFAEARLDVALSPDKTAVQSLKHVWRFDDVFSSTVLVEFDKNADNKLDDAELKDVSNTIYTSIGEFGYFQLVTLDGKDVTMNTPPNLKATFENNQLVVTFESQPKDPLKLTGKIDFGIYDPTYYTAIDYIEDKDLVVAGLPAACAPQVIRPDPDEVMAQNQKAMDEAFMSDPSNVNAGMGRLFATKLELTCQAKG